MEIYVPFNGAENAVCAVKKLLIHSLGLKSIIFHTCNIYNSIVWLSSTIFTRLIDNNQSLPHPYVRGGVMGPLSLIHHLLRHF